MQERQIQHVFQNVLKFIRQEHGIVLNVSLEIDYAGSYPKPRDFAQTSGIKIYFSPKILEADESRFRGLLYHEIGHVLLMQAGDYTHSERRADQIAELCFGVPIYYDIEGVQTISGGVRPRPSHLPQ